MPIIVEQDTTIHSLFISVNRSTCFGWFFYPSSGAHINVSTASKDKAVPVQASTGPEVSRKLRLPDFVTTAQDGGKVVSLTHRPPLPPRKYSWYSFLLEAESTPHFDQ